MKRYILYILILVFIIGNVALADESKEGNINWWKNAFGYVDASDNPNVERANSVLKALWQSLQPQVVKTPRLLVIPKKHTQWLESWAISIADGSIILAEDLFDIVFLENNNQSKTPDSMMAFILAHELGHIVHEDHKRFGPTMLFSSKTDSAKARAALDAELSADQFGIFSITQAGYEPKYIVDKGKASFFYTYESQIRSKLNGIILKGKFLHPDPLVRAKELRNRIASFSAKIELFDDGVKAYVNRDFHLATTKFLKFSKYFNAREVMNNVGLSYYRLARRIITGCEGLENSLEPAIKLDYETQAKKLILDMPEQLVAAEKSLKCRKDPDFIKFMKESNRYLLTAALKDSKHIHSFINLSAYLITSGEYNSAIKVTEKALEIEPGNEYVLNNKALALYLSNPKLHAKKALKVLSSIKTSADVRLAAIKNISLISN
jgi:tetratricopeptide (TPR) repeat protein